MTKVSCWSCDEELVHESVAKSIKDEPNYCPHCGSKIDHQKILEKKGYENWGQKHLYSPNFSKSTMPYQGWKIHIPASPFETYILCEELLDKLIENNINHKVVQSKPTLESWIDTNHKNKYKSVVIYPSIDSNKKWVTKEFPGAGKCQVFIKNPENRKITLNGKNRKEEGINYVSTNVNSKNSKKIVEMIESFLSKSDISVQPSNKTPDIHKNQSDEKYVNINGKRTRVTFRYDKIYARNGVEVSEGTILEVERRNLSNYQNKWTWLKDSDKVIGVEGTPIKQYREATDVLDFKGFSNPFR